MLKVERYLLEAKLQEFRLTIVPKLANATHTRSQHTQNTWKHSGNTLATWGRLEMMQNTKGVGWYL